MTGPELAVVALLGASALHLGFQLTVTGVVYPALARVPPADWAVAHTRHSRGIVPVVVLAYGAVVVCGAWALVVAPSYWVLVSLAGGGLSLLTTALVAAPTHGRLAAGRDPALVQRLLRADLVRSLGAALGLAGALLAVLSLPGCTIAADRDLEAETELLVQPPSSQS